MRSITALILLFFLTFNNIVLGLQFDTRTLTIADIPSCGLTCLLLTVPASGCGIADIECQCNNQKLAYSTAACMLANCTMADSLGTAKVQADLCNLSNESKSTKVLVSITIVFIIVCVGVALRIATRVLTKRVKTDDYVILVALLLSTATYGCAYAMVQNGFGNHLWNLQPGQLQAALRYFYACWNLYVITLGLVKVSLIVFYLQIFQSHRFRIICYIFLGYIATSTLAIQFLTIFSCFPIRSFWDRDIKGVCLNVNAIGYANSANAILQDLIILFLPMPCLFKLRMKRWRKIAVALMLAVGAFGCITTMIRLRALLGFSISIDPTWDYTEVTIWTGAELASGIVCASLPAIRQLLTMVLPKRFLSLLTSRSQSRSTPVLGRGSTHSAQRQRKGFSVFPLPSFSEHGSSSYGTKTAVSSSSWNKSQDYALQDMEHGNMHQQRPKTSSWAPLRTLFQGKSRSFQTSFWSSFDRHGSPPLSPQLARPSINLGMSSGTVVPESLGTGSVDEVQLIRPPEALHRNRGDPDTIGDDITALPRVGILPDDEFSKSSLPRIKGIANRRRYI